MLSQGAAAGSRLPLLKARADCAIQNGGRHSYYHGERTSERDQVRRSTVARLTRFTVTADIVTDITSSLSIEDILAGVVKRSVQALEVWECDVYEYSAESGSVTCLALTDWTSPSAKPPTPAAPTTSSATPTITHLYLFMGASSSASLGAAAPTTRRCGAGTTAGANARSSRGALGCELLTAPPPAATFLETFN